MDEYDKQKTRKCTCEKVRKDGLTYICPDCWSWPKVNEDETTAQPITD